MEKINTEDKLEFWRLVVEEFENSEKSIKEQSQENDIALGQFYTWSKKVREWLIEDVGIFIRVNDSEEPPTQNKSGSVIPEYGEYFRFNLEDGFSPLTLNKKAHFSLRDLKENCEFKIRNP